LADLSRCLADGLDLGRQLGNLGVVLALEQLQTRRRRYQGGSCCNMCRSWRGALLSFPVNENINRPSELPPRPALHTIMPQSSLYDRASGTKLSGISVYYPSAARGEKKKQDKLHLHHGEHRLLAPGPMIMV
jgi:hypothetical protein